MNKMDAQYFMVRNSAVVVEWVNKHLIQCMTTYDLPELQHEQIHLQSELDICYPSWANPITIPNGMGAKDIYEITLTKYQEYLTKTEDKN